MLIPTWKCSLTLSFKPENDLYLVNQIFNFQALFSILFMVCGHSISLNFSKATNWTLYFYNNLNFSLRESQKVCFLPRFHLEVFPNRPSECGGHFVL